MSVHPTAIVAPGAQIGEGVRIGPYTVVHEAVIMEDGCDIGPFCELGVEPQGVSVGPLHLGAGALVRGHSVLYAGSTYGPGLRTGHRVTLRERLVVGEDCQIGTLCDFQGDAVIGRSLRSHSNVHVGKHTKIGDYVWLFPYVVLTNDPHPPSNVVLGVTIEDFAAVATMSTVLPGVTVGRGSLVGAHSLVRRDVLAGHVVAGVPARDVGPASLITNRETGASAYPWRRTFHRGYPESITADWATATDDAEA